MNSAKSWNDDEIELDLKDNFGRGHPVFQRCGFIYSADTTLKLIAKLRLLITKFEQLTDNHFFLMKICDHFEIE